MKFKCFKFVILSIVLVLLQTLVMAEDGSGLWLRYVQVSDSALLTQYKSVITQIVAQNYSLSATLTAARRELNTGFAGLLAQTVPYSDTAVTQSGAIVVGTPASSSIINGLGLSSTLKALGDEGYVIQSTTVNGYNVTVIASNGDLGVLYGTFSFLRLMQTQKSLSNLNISNKPKIQLRHLDYWDVTRNYAGGGNFFNWSALPGTLDPRYTVFARACASVGINGIVVNCVNADNNFLIANLSKEKALADLWRPYGVKVLVSVNFSAPKDIGGLGTADPLDSRVIAWWATQANTIYAQIPDYGGWLVKASSEGQSGPGDYGRTHAQGANCLAAALAPHGGNVFWRSFVYNASVDADRLKRAYLEFKPLDGKFNSNVFVQSKYGPLDFQPREPFHPMFGTMPNTNQNLELQITQEYTGQSTMLCYLGTLWSEYLNTETYANGVAGNPIGKIIDGTTYNKTLTCMAGVANIGNAVNYCGHDFSQANWFTFGRLAWDWTQTPDGIADDWIRMTWSNNLTAVNTIRAMMMGSREALVNYQEPLGLMHQMRSSDHYGPAPSETISGHEDWSPTYYNKCDSAGIGYNRSSTGSNLVGQYYSQIGNVYNNINTCPENLLAAFFHVPWTRKMSSGRTFWDELCFREYDGVQYVTNLKAQWASLQSYIDSSRFSAVTSKLAQHETDAKNWRDVTLNYYKGFSGLPIPSYVPPTPTPTATPTPTPTNTPPLCSLKGDVNGDGTVSIIDALLTAQASVGLNTSNYNAVCADVNCTGTIDIIDALLIAQRSAGLVSQFPCS